MKNYRNKVKYLAYYNCAESLQNRYAAPSAVTKVDYILHVLSSLKKPTSLLSMSGSLDKSYPSTIVRVNEYINIFFFQSLRGENLLVKHFHSLYFKINLFFSLLRDIKHDDILIVYHSLFLIKIVSIIKKIKNCKLIIETEEIYSDVLENEKLKKYEINYLKTADAYIFSTSKLNTIINECNKPFVISHGTYQIEYDRNCRNKVWRSRGANIEDVHCVYAGTLDPRKGGALTAVNVAAFLPESYHIHILGFGTDEDIKTIHESIEKVSINSKAKITYDGVLSGENYIQFIQSCDIGLSTQTPFGAFNDTSFPSKVLSYLTNGLQVVSIRIPVLEYSDVADLICFYDEQIPEKIAEAILQIRLQNNSNRKKIEELDKKFTQDLNQLFSILEQ